MRPTVDEQLAGAARLLRTAEPDLPPDSRDLVRNARRLVERVAGSWSQALPFLLDDNERTAALLGDPPAAPESPTADLREAAALNEQLRARLGERIRDLPPGPERDAIGAHLRTRVAADPT